MIDEHHRRHVRCGKGHRDDDIELVCVNEYEVGALARKRTQARSAFAPRRPRIEQRDFDPRLGERRGH
jgi:hypothetical protein